MQTTTLSASFRLLLLVVLSLSALITEAQKSVRLIEIHSGWGGLGTPQNANVIIRQEKGKFLCDGKLVDASLVGALVAALDAPLIAKPDLANLGITPAWLKAHATSAEGKLPGKFFEATARQKELFATSFTDLAMIAKVVPQLFQYASSDDYPYTEVDVLFEDGSALSAKSHSYYAFLMPWELSEKGEETYNANISRALSALMPPHTVNKGRLAGEGFVSALAGTLMLNIEPEWNLRGVESRAGDALAALRSVYTVERADINAYHSQEFGKSWDPKGPHETNLHAIIHKSTMPANVFDELILLYDHDKVEGVQEFLNSGTRYEALALSVPWLKDYIQLHPEESVYIFQVHNTSLGEHAMHTFALDMKARGREDLIAEVQAQQSQITLLKVGAADWLLFPDKHMMLWRYGGPSGLLKWTPADFPPGQCGIYQSNYGGCSGRETLPDGTLAAEPAPRDQVCMAVHRTTQAVGVPRTDELFPVMDHDRAGFIDRNGKVIIPLCFDKVGAFSEGLARFERDRHWGYIDASGSVVIEPRFPWAEEFSEGLARVQVSGEALGYDGRWGFIDRTGKVVISPDYKTALGGRSNIGRSGDQEGAFQDGLAKIEVEGKTGFIDKAGEVVIPPEFTYAYPFAEGLAAVTKSSSGDDGWGYIDRTGKWVIAPQFEWGSSFQERLAPVNRKHDCGYIDPTGAYVLRPPVSPGEKDCATVWGDFVEGLSRWKFGNKYGFIDHTGKVVIKPRFDLTFHFSEGFAAVQIGGKWGYIDKTGKVVIEPRALARAEDFHHGLAFVTTLDGRYGYIDKSGNYVWTPRLLYIN
jgi:hypothetical protein